MIQRGDRFVRMLAAGTLVFMLASVSASRESTVPPPGIREHTPAVYALTGARLVTAPGKTIENGTMVLRDGIIEAAGAGIAIPADATVIDLRGKTIYPGLIDSYSEKETPREGRGGGAGGPGRVSGPGTPSVRGGANYWNPEIVPQTRMDREYSPDADLNKTLRGQGITARLLAPGPGIVKGTSVLVSTGDEGGTRSTLKDQAALHAKLTTRGSFDSEDYPNSPMGAMSLFRQAMYDAEWYTTAWEAYRKNPSLARPENNDALAALSAYRKSGMPVVIDASDELYALRADQVAREFGLNVIIHGSGNEYRRLKEIAANGRPVIVPVNFPKAPNVKTPEAAMSVSLEELLHWDIAPDNPKLLDQAGVKIALSSDGLKDKGEFLASVRRAVKRGLSRDAALRALTTTPAELFGVSSSLGSLEAGKLAQFIVTDGDLFDGETKVFETWIDGNRIEIESAPLADLRGTWRLNLSEGMTAGDTVTLCLKGEASKLSGALSRNSKEAKLSEVALSQLLLGFSFKGDSLGWPGVVRMSATAFADSLIGSGVWSNEETFTWRAARTAPFAPEPDTAKKQDKPDTALFAANYPLGAYGVPSIPAAPAAVVIQNATVWTCGPQGKIENASVLIENGKITAVGTLSASANATVIDGTGKHITPGLIDCHSHIATDGGINESGQTISAEVRISDFINPDDISIYRQLAGGLTASNILHGSANTIGGQNQVIKLRWGASPEELKFAGAPPGIKFALGENVKQSNWGDQFTTRYPQSRMGVEQLVRDEFKAALDYKARWDAWKKSKKGIPPRRDLELDAIVEILNGERLIHCHSYRQDEILALMRTCEDFGVKIASFQHILEGYKVAEAMAAHGVGGSSFSDWWAYKIEVWDAIPYNGALMHNAGVVVSFNSDDAELARRLNWEAAKAVKYGGVPEEEALKFVTINPATQLHVQDRVGSIEVGKDADLVLWSGPPLSTLSICEQTWVDGRKYFDRAEDLLRRAENERMRAALIQKALDTGETSDGPPGRKGPRWPRHDIFCPHHDHMEEEYQ